MANRGRATFAKRQKEIARQERAREKAAKRVERKETKVKLDRDGRRGRSRHRRHRAGSPAPALRPPDEDQPEPSRGAHEQ